MKPKRTFTSEFKRQTVEELLSGTATRAQISRKHNLSGGLISHWKEQYEQGMLCDNYSYRLTTIILSD